jgi:hypothetical protein
MFKELVMEGAKEETEEGAVAGAVGMAAGKNDGRGVNTSRPASTLLCFVCELV